MQRRAWFLAALYAVLALEVTPAYAIPSPELIVSSLSSFSQLWALVGALAGGGALAARGGRGRADSLAMRRWIVALATLAGVAIAVGIIFYLNVQSERTVRLQATLLRPTPKTVDGATLDPLLREMPYSRQAASPAGLSTTQVEGLIAEIEAGRRSDVIALDIRETAEIERGSLKIARAVRFPDLPTSGIDFKGRTALLFCHNGNRSGETCAKLASLGIDCRFMIGGYEKWLVEGRVLAQQSFASLLELRAIAPYPNQTTLLDTNEVKEHLARQAVMVDVRYPGEFGVDHLPGAINLPIRPTPTADLARLIDAVPPGPILAPCYDRRSCFYADILGLELTRRGRVFLGRYTLPWEYFVASQPPPHVVTWMAQRNRSLFQKAVGLIAEGLEAASVHLGVLGAIGALAILMRAIVWPLAAKADRDQRVSRLIAPELAQIKSAWAHDPDRRARLLRAKMDQHQLTPLRNLLALLFLPILVVSLDGVSAFGRGHAGEPLVSLMWIADLSAPDPLCVLPGLFGVLLAVYLHAAFEARGWMRLGIWGLAFPALVGVGTFAPACVNAYMVVSGLLLLVQRWVVGFDWCAPRRWAQSCRRMLDRARLGHDGLVALSDVSRLSRCGNKALRLGQLRQEGITVPDGVVLTASFLAVERDEAAQARARARLWRQLGVGRAGTVAVRSSAQGEDGADQSFAGVFESLLHVDRHGFKDAVTHVASSFSSERARSYGQGGAGNILVQPMVRALYAGVIFTQDPVAPGCGLIEWVVGTGDALVSGTVTPSSIHMGRLTHTLVGRPDAAAAPFDVARLWAIARQAEALFGRPQDIEWAYDGRRFLILQSRDIVADSGEPAPAREEWARLLGSATRPTDEAVLAVDAMAEQLPRPTPASLSLLNDFWSVDGSVAQAARSLGLSMPPSANPEADAAPLYTTVFGSLYCDAAVRASRALTLTAALRRRLAGRAFEIEKATRTRHLPSMRARSDLAAALSLPRLSTPALMRLLADTRAQVIQTHIAVDVVNIVAQVYAEDARASLSAAGFDPSAILALPKPTAFRRELARLPVGGCHRTRSLAPLIGHRAQLDYELACPRFGEAEETLVEAARAFASIGVHPRGLVYPAGMTAQLRRSVKRTLAFVTLKEDAKHESLREVAFLRRLLCEADRRFDLEGRVFWLSLDEITALSVKTAPRWAAVAAIRQSSTASFESAVALPPELDRRDIERGPLAGPTCDAPLRPGVMTSTRVSGQNMVEGRVIRPSAADCASGAPLVGFESGDIIVARSLHPAWLPHLMVCRGVVVETGGWLSHVAILARERGIAMAIAARGIEPITTGMQLRLEANGVLTLV